jgi:hypothetical protein
MIKEIYMVKRQQGLLPELYLTIGDSVFSLIPPTKGQVAKIFQYLVISMC